MNEALTKFEAYLLTERRVTTNTFNAYKNDLQQLVSFLARRQSTLEYASRDQLKDFLKHLRMQGVAARSMARKISSIKVFFAYASDYFGWKNYAEDLSFPRLEKKLPSYLQEEEVDLVLRAAEQDSSDVGVRNKVIIFLLYVSGMRISELIDTRISDIHFDTGFINVRGKGGKGRLIPLPQDMFAVLKHYIKNVHHALVYKSGMEHVDYLFPVYYGKKIKQITRQACWGIVKKICKRAGITRSISPHKLRHSLATHMLKKGADLRSLQLLLGHESISTVEIYTHLDTGYLRKIYDDKHPRSEE